MVRGSEGAMRRASVLVGFVVLMAAGSSLIAHHSFAMYDMQKSQTMTGRLNRGEGTAGKLLTDAELYNRMNRVVGSLDQLSSRLNEGQGTAGQLLQDKQLYENMNAAASELRGLIAEIRKDPKRYLNVKVSIF